jgi:ABC-type glucose/galactose transport system permease subunit
MGVKAQLKLVSTTGGGKKLGSVKPVFTRAGLALLLVVFWLCWNRRQYARDLRRFWVGENIESEEGTGLRWSEVSVLSPSP